MQEKKKIPILMYHQIDVPPPKGTRLRGSTVHPARFKSQMRWFYLGVVFIWMFHYKFSMASCELLMLQTIQL